MSDAPPSKLSKKLISVVLPIYNEESCAEQCLQRMHSVMEQLLPRYDYELVFVNDGSSDNTLEILKGERQKNKSVRILNFSRNFGHQMAISAGLEHAKGEAIIVLDSDLQDPPEFIPKLIEKWEEGYDVVHAQRIRRHGETAFKKVVSATYYRFLKEVSEIEIPVDVGDFRLLSRRAVDAINSLPERHRYIRGMACWVGFKQTILPYEREQRFAGVPKYTLAKLAKLAFDGVFSFSTFPLRIASYIGYFCLLLSFATFLLLVFLLVSWHPDQGAAWTLITTFFTFMLLLIGGVQLISLGIVGEYIGYLFAETRRRPLYLVSEIE